MSLVPAKSDLRADQQGGVSLWYIATRAGVLDMSDNWVLNYVRLLQANEGFPAPLPYFDLSGNKREGIRFKSRWTRDCVDAWFDGFLPPRLAAVADEARRERDAAALDAAAGQLARIGGGRPRLVEACPERRGGAGA